MTKHTGTHIAPREQETNKTDGRTLAEGLPVADIDGSLSKHRPHGHLVSPRVRGRDDAEEIIAGEAQDALRLLNSQLQLSLRFMPKFIHMYLRNSE